MYDSIHIEQNVIKTVSIEGAVKRPGIYKITEDETLTDLINRAEGIKKMRILLVGFYQEDVKEIQAKQVEAEYRSLIKKLVTSVVTAKHRLWSDWWWYGHVRVYDFIYQLKNYKPDGRVITEFNLNRLQSMPKDNILMKADDKIFIPEITNSVLVIGEVESSGSFPYRDNKSVNYYIQQAGGIDQLGDEGYAVLVQPNGISKKINFGLSLRSNKTEIYPGSVIFVERDFEPQGISYAAVLLQ